MLFKLPWVAPSFTWLRISTVALISFLCKKYGIVERSNNGFSSYRGAPLWKSSSSIIKSSWKKFCWSCTFPPLQLQYLCGGKDGRYPFLSSVQTERDGLREKEHSPGESPIWFSLSLLFPSSVRIKRWSWRQYWGQGGSVGLTGKIELHNLWGS